jgi:hypothetical protein
MIIQYFLFFWVAYEIDVDWVFLLISWFFRIWTRTAKEAWNGNHNSATKAPPTLDFPSTFRYKYLAFFVCLCRSNRYVVRSSTDMVAEKKISLEKNRILLGGFLCLFLIPIWCAWMSASRWANNFFFLNFVPYLLLPSSFNCRLHILFASIHQLLILYPTLLHNMLAVRAIPRDFMAIKVKANLFILIYQIKVAHVASLECYSVFFSSLEMTCGCPYIYLYTLFVAKEYPVLSQFQS